MKILPAIVLVKNISSSIPRADFSELLLKQAAELILQAGGEIINPIILSRKGLEHYEVIEGHFEYYAALTAKEMDLQRGETINAYIVEIDNEDLIRQQIAVFRKSQLVDKQVYPMERLAILEKKLDKLSELAGLFTQTVQEIRQEINQLRTQEPVTETPRPEPVLPVALVESEKSPVEETKPTSPTVDLSPDEVFLNAINTLSSKELLAKLSKVVNQKIIKSIDEERQKQPFTSVNDIKRVKGLGKATLEKIRRLWP